MLKGYVDIKSGNCHPNEPDEYWSVWPDPDSFEFFYRAIIPEPEFKKITIPKRKDDVCNAMIFHIEQFEQQHLRTAECTELWNVMKAAKLAKWGLTFKDDVISNDKNKPTDLDSFKDRYDRYYPKGG